jgi:hypothetical protein
MILFWHRLTTVSMKTILQMPRFTAIFLALLAFSATEGFAYTTDDPEVLEMVDRGIKHLEDALGAKTYYDTGKAHLGGWGEWALAGYAHYKVVHDASHPVVKRGLEGALGIARGLTQPNQGGHTLKTNYNAGVAAMLLAEVDRDKYRKELELIAEFFKRYQLPSGPYTYLGDKIGDVSQTQYAVLALWTLDHAGVRVNFDGVPKTVGWLTRVQDKGGGWPYMVEDNRAPGLISQPGVTPSLAVAGGSAILIAGDLLRLWGDSLDPNDPGIPDLPKSVKIYRADSPEVKRPKLPPEPILNAITNCEKYLDSNSPDPGKRVSSWPYYQLYSLERYESFREVAFELPKDPSPDWYNGGVEFLKKVENAGGGWSQGDIMPSSVNTAFAVLFLIRSTQRAIQRVSTGTLAGGYGLPKDTTKITVSGTQIKGEPAASAVGDLLSLLEGDDPDKLETNSIPENLKLATDPEARRIQIDRLERLVRGSQSWQARRVAARLLGQSDEFRVVPALIFALSDPDSLVKRYANDGLAFISRKFQTYPLPDKPTDEDIRRAQQAWREWFLAAQPNYVFLDEAF